MDFSPLAISLAIGVVFVYIASKVVQFFKNGGNPPLPPGPKGLPIVGNLNDLPKPGEFEAHHWLKHKELYGSFPQPATKS